MVFTPNGTPVRGRWYFVPEDAPWIPQPTVFNSSRWRPTQGVGPPDVGEIRPDGDVWFSGSPTVNDCGVAEGSADAFQGNSDPVNGPFYSWCCNWQPIGVAAEASTATGSISVVRNAQGVAAEAETATGSIAFYSIAPGCGYCASGSWMTWYLVVAGVTGTTDCVNQNGTWALPFIEDECDYSLQYSGFPQRKIWLLVDSGGTGYLRFYDSDGNQQAVYTTAEGAWECFGASNTLTLTEVDQCSGWPSTLTVTNS